MDGLQFEHRCAELLRYRGFHKVTVTKGSGDQGIDIIAHKNGTKYGIQCKYYSYPVGNKAIQEAYAGAEFYDCDSAIVMTNNTFTKAARELAAKLDVELWEYCSPNGSSSLITKLMHIFNAFFLVIGITSAVSSYLYNYPQETILNYMGAILLIFASTSGLLGWHHFLPCIICAMSYIGVFLLICFPHILITGTGWYGSLLLLPAFITLIHAFYSKYRNREPVQ